MKTRKYRALYRGKTITIEAETSYAAQQEAQKQFQAEAGRRKVKGYDITVMLQDVVHTPDF